MKENVLATYNVNVVGEGTQPMLFAHGLGCDQSVWRYVSPAFEKDYKIILFDYIGSGKADKTKYNKEKYSSLNGYAQDILDICEALELKDVIYVGHSVSSIIGMLAAIQEPSFFSTLVMIGPSPSYINEPPYLGGFDKADIEQLLALMRNDYEKWTGFFAPRVMVNPDKPELSKNLQNSFCSVDRDIMLDFAKATFVSDNRRDLGRLSVPTLILQPDEDIVAPKHVGDYMHKHISGSTIYYMKATGHFPHLSAVEETVEAISGYLHQK